MIERIPWPAGGPPGRWSAARAHIVTLLSPVRRPRPAAAHPRARGGGGSDALDLLSQLLRDLLGVGVTQVAHLRVAARFERGVEVRDQRLEAQALRRFAAHQHAVSALVGHHFHRRMPPPSAAALV